MHTRFPLLLLLLFPASLPAEQAKPAPPASQDELFGLDRIWDMQIQLAEKAWKNVEPGQDPPGKQKKDPPKPGPPKQDPPEQNPPRRRTQNPTQRRTQGFSRILPKTELVERFDADKNGRLDRAERDKARIALAADPAAQRRRRTSRAFGSGTLELPEPVPEAERIAKSSAKSYPGKGLYDRSVLRTLFLDFPADDWFEELTTFYRTDVEVPATLTVDGKRYPGVGVRFRGSSSYLMVRSSHKKSFNVSIDHSDPELRLEGYRTLNLLNGNQDSSFLREVLFSHVAQNYLPVSQVNFVKLVVNGANWGIYQNAEQFNRDYLKRAYGSRGGVRWKVLRNQRGLGALTYRGEDVASYPAYELKTNRSEKKDAAAWQRLITLCRVLHETSAADLPKVLPPILDVDEVLWYCALENVFVPSDGYMNQGYDYRVYEDRFGRFHLVSHDCNEILQTPMRMTRSRASIRSGPLFNATNPQRPILHKMLAVPQWRARYLAHVRTIATRWLDWEVLGPVCASYHELLGDEIEKDKKKLFSARTIRRIPERRRGSQWSLKELVKTRRDALLGHELMQGPWPELGDVTQERLDDGVRITARLGQPSAGTTLFVHYRKKKKPHYKAVPMHDDGAHGDGASGDGVYGGTVPAKARAFYIEARGAKATTFHPEEAAAGPTTVR